LSFLITNLFDFVFNVRNPFTHPRFRRRYLFELITMLLTRSQLDVIVKNIICQ